MPTLARGHSNEEEEKLANVHDMEEEILSNPSENGILAEAEGLQLRRCDPYNLYDSSSTLAHGSYRSQSPSPKSPIRDFGTNEPDDDCFQTNICTHLSLMFLALIHLH